MDFCTCGRIRIHMFTALVLIILLRAAVDAGRVDSNSNDNNGDYYSKTCPQATAIVKNTVRQILQNDRSIAAAILRLQFHDCFVRGCDASVLLNSPDNTAEKDGLKGSLRGFEQIDQIKAAVEQECPGVVSCADILALATRDAVVEVGGESWYVRLGRLDGKVSNISEPPLMLPFPDMTYEKLVANFAAKGFSEEEMVILSGSHSIGRALCGLAQWRFYHFNGTIGSTDPSIDPQYAEDFKRKCPMDNTSTVEMPLDPTVDTFDNEFYKAVLANRVVFVSDQALSRNPTGKNLVTRYSQPGSSFLSDFAVAMTKLIDLEWTTDGEVRRLCYARNQ